MRFGLVNHAAILAVTEVGVDGTQSVSNWTLSNFSLFSASHDWLFGDNVFKQIGVHFIPPGQLITSDVRVTSQLVKMVLRVLISGVPFGEFTTGNGGTIASMRHQETVE